jgi:hypothetical protein
MGKRTSSNGTPPARSRKSISPTLAYAEARKTADDKPAEEPAVDKPDDEKAAAVADDNAGDDKAEKAEKAEVKHAKAEKKAEKKDKHEPKPEAEAEPEAAKPEPEAAKPEPEPEAAKPEPPKPAPEPPAPATVAIGKASEPAAPVYTVLPEPSDVVPGDPDADEPPPGLVPPGDSRSMRRKVGDVEEFALVYRRGAAVVIRMGVVGKRGTWRVTHYPHMGSASHAYAQECSRLHSDGYLDHRG